MTGSSTISRWIGRIGPGVITAALVFGPGSLTVNTRLGAMYGYSFLWVIALSVVFMIVYTRLSATIGCVTDATLMTIISNRVGRGFTLLLGVGICCIGASFQAGNAIGAGIAIEELVGGPRNLWIVLVSTAAVALLFARQFYRVLETVMVGLVLLMFLSFMTTLLLSRAPWLQVAKGLIPTFTPGASVLVVALVASSFSIVGAFYQSYLVQAKGWLAHQVHAARRDSMAGILVLALLSSVVMMCAASVLHTQQLAVQHVADLGRALQPLFGSWASGFFMIGLFAASFSSLLGNATIAGSIFSDALGWSHRYATTSVRAMISVVIILGSAVAIIFGRLPLELIVVAQTVTVIIAPAAAWALWRTARDASIMGALTYRGFQNVLPAVGFLLLLVMAVMQFATLVRLV